jgi:heptosyltransferase-2
VSPDSEENILVVGPSWVGDMVMAQSLFIELKRRYPQAAIDVVAPEWSIPLIARMPEVRQGIGLPVKHRELGLLHRWRIAKKLRNNKYQRAIILPRSIKSALLPFFANIPQRTAYRGEYRYGLINDIRGKPAPPDKTVRRFVALGLPRDIAGGDFQYAFPRLRVDPDNQAELIKRLQLDPAMPAVGIMPGAEYGPAKQWPPEYYADLIAKLAERGYQAWLFGSKKDHPVAEKIIQLAGDRGINICGKTTIPDVIDLIAATRLAISNDSGLMHVAAAVGCPVVAIYGSSDPLFTPPLSDKGIVMYLGIECSPCFQRQCPYGHYRCLREITVDQVLVAGLRALGNPSSFGS